jgi:hypothetical protein
VRAKKTRKVSGLPYKVVKIEWTDAFSEDGWKDIKRLPENKADAKVNTLGWLVNEDDDFYYIANSVSAQQAACCMVVPKSMVSSFEEITLAK